jgi:electron-transferring-flavoprotein dehydrogenase
MGAADAIADALAEGRSHDVLEALQEKVLATGIAAELFPVRNVKPLWSRFGTIAGVLLAGIDMWCNSLFKLSPLGTLKHLKPDYAALRPLADTPAKRYARPDGTTTFDRASSVFLSNIAHDEDQPVHLRLADPAIPVERNLPVYGEPAPLYCPAGVYEIAEVDGKPVFRIHAANCVHCKTCDIKDPAQNITWVPPEGGSGPNYAGM